MRMPVRRQRTAFWDLEYVFTWMAVPLLAQLRPTWLTHNQTIPETVLWLLQFGIQARSRQRSSTLILATSSGRCVVCWCVLNVLVSPESGTGTSLNS